MSIFQMKPVRDFSKINGAGPKKRHSVAERTAYDLHGWRCHYCNSAGPLTTDHIIPQAHGGTSDPSNLVPSCRTCNSAKGKRDYDEFKEIIAAEMIAYQTWFEGV